MKRWLFYVVAGVALLVLPKGQGVDVAALEPVELIYIQKEDNRIRVETDTNELGLGNTLEEALQDTEDSAMGKIFLETVDYILLTEQTKQVLSELEGVVRPSVKVILVTGPIDIKRMVPFLKTHKPELTLKDWLMGSRDLPKLMTAEERYYLV